MESNTRLVQLQNMVNKTVGVIKPEYGVNRKWTKKGQTIPLPYDVVEQLLWDEGFRNMIDRGILYINDLQDKIDLGLEPYWAEEPENIIVLSDKQIENLLKDVPYSVFKTEIKKYTLDQINRIVNYALENEIVDVNKCSYLKELTGLDIMKSIATKRDLEREEKNRKVREDEDTKRRV